MCESIICFFQSPLDALQSPPDGGAYAVLPPDVTADVTIKHVTADVTTSKPPGDVKAASEPREKPPSENSSPEAVFGSAPRKSTQDVKPKGKSSNAQQKPKGAAAEAPSSAKHKESGLDANSNRTSRADDVTADATPAKHVAESAKPNSIARLDLGRFSRGPARKTDKQNANVTSGATGSKIPTKPTGIPSPVDGSHKTLGKPSPAGKPAGAAGALGKVGKYTRTAHAQRDRNRKSVEPPAGVGAGAGGSSIIAQAIAATSQERQAAAGGGSTAGTATPAAARPDSLLPGEYRTPPARAHPSASTPNPRPPDLPARVHL